MSLGGIPSRFIWIAVAVMSGCTSAPAPLPPAPAPTPVVSRQPPPTYERGIKPRPAPPLPPVPLIEGPLEPRLVYPAANGAISVRDSNFVFGSAGNGHATLTINGATVPVAPNGTFLAFLPVPSPTAPRYELVARTATDSARLTIPVRVPPPRPDLALTGRLVVDSSSVTRTGGLVLRDSDAVRVGIRAPLNATVSVNATGGAVFPLVHIGGNMFATDVPAADLRAGGTLYASRDRDTVHFSLAKVSVARPRTFISLGDSAAARDTDAYVIGRSTPQGTYKWMFVPGTIVEMTGRSGDNVRVRLDNRLEAWVDSSSARPLPAGYPAPRRTVGAMTLVPDTGWVDLVMPVRSPPPYLIEQELHRITLTLYGTQATPDIIKFLGNDSLVRMINWVPDEADRVVLRLELTQEPYGYLVFFEPGRGFVLRLRRAPKVDVARPLAGLTITVDPGHPPGGAIGPTGYTEAQGVLAVGLKLRDILEQRGARVVMTRTDMNAVDLHLRSIIARRANAHLLISVHENAFGEGTNPFPNVGTSTLFFHPQSEPVARLVQQGMMNEMGLRDLGIHYQNIAIGRTMWMPSIITEGLFLMLPAQENAAKDPAFQERYARGVADGIEAYFRSLGQR